MPQIPRSDRNQIQLIKWESYISTDSIVRVIDRLVDVIELSKLGFTNKGKSKEGRPAYEAGVLLKLYLYGYLNRIRSSRQLEKAARRNVELFWLLCECQPCYKTIADFRKVHAKALQQFFVSFNRFLKGAGFFEGDVVAIDGTKIAAQNSKKNNYNDKKIKQHLKYIKEQTANYLVQMEELDKLERGGNEELVAVKEKLAKLEEREAKYENLSDQLASVRQNNQAQISTTDPDARALPKKMNIVEMSYNVQVGAVSTNKLITNYEVTNENDTYALSGMAKEAKLFLGKDKIQVLADKGYDTGSELKACALNGVETYVAPRQKNTSKKHPDFRKEKFLYNKLKDSYTCPAGKDLKTNGNSYKKNATDHRKVYTVKVYKLLFHVCNGCPHKLKCAGEANLKNSKGRPIERTEYEEYLVANRERVANNKAFYRTRQQIVEHPFGTIKRGWGYSYTLLKGKEKVSGELGLIFTCYNLRRIVSILGVEELLQRIGAALLVKMESKWAILKRCAGLLFGESYIVKNRNIIQEWLSGCLCGFGRVGFRVG